MSDPATIGRFADVLLPLPLPRPLTYRIPVSPAMHVVPGIRVAVPLGPSRIYAGIVTAVHGHNPEHEAREILELIDTAPVVGEAHMAFWRWIADYYMCSPGEVMNAALPMPARAGNESLVHLEPGASDMGPELSEYGYRILTALRERDIPVSEISEVAGTKKVRPLLEDLREKGLIRYRQEWNDPFRPKLSLETGLAPEYEDEDKLRDLLDSLGRRAPKQADVLMILLGKGVKSLPKRELTRDDRVSPSAYHSLLKKGVIVETETQESYFEPVAAGRDPSDIELNTEQQQALLDIKSGLAGQGTVLLHGVTGSGKTEIYIRLIDEVLRQGRQVLYLVPEIALTSQLVRRLQDFFGSRVGVYHSRHTPAQRTEAWQRAGRREGGFPLVLGARSALFLPFHDLGLVIVDEEHDASYKQIDPAPRYHARDSAIYLARLCGAGVVLGSATPSVESYYNARQGKFGLATLSRRFGSARLPEVLVADMDEAYRKRQVRSHFSELLIGHMSEALERREQVILFQNRRGFSLRLECQACHWMPQCRHCDVTLIYHKGINKLKCHYCGYSMSPPPTCESCGSDRLNLKGFGTEKIEEELPLLFPKARIARLDLDTTRSKHAYARTIGAFEKGEIDILVGTQMVSKGLDFDRVAVVGIMNADNMVNFPDFRAFERSFQHLAQVSGRAGRKERKGRVIIQTFQPYHPVIRQVMTNDYADMYRDQLLERRNFKYPPFVRLVRITFLHRDRDKLQQGARELTAGFREILGKDQVLGPEYPLMMRIKGLFQKQTLLKLPREGGHGAPKRRLASFIATYATRPEMKGLRVIVDVDPV